MFPISIQIITDNTDSFILIGVQNVILCFKGYKMQNKPNLSIGDIVCCSYNDQQIAEINTI